MLCKIHNKEMRAGKYGPYCPTRLQDDSWCKYKGEGEYSPQGSVKAPVKEDRNWDKEAYEKCCSIWIQGLMAHGFGGKDFPFDLFWDTFQAIHKDSDKRFAKGWAKAEATFKPADVYSTPAPSDDYQTPPPSDKDVPW